MLYEVITGEQLMGLEIIHRPDGAAGIDLVDIGGGEMQSDKRGIGPVEQAGRQTVMLGDGQPMPDRIA